MTNEALDALHENFRANFLTDAQYKAEFQRQAEALLPNIGDSDLAPALLTVHITGFDPVEFGIDYHLLMLDDFNDGERRQHYVQMLGEKAVTEKRKAVMVIMASETWISGNLFRADGSRRYDLPSEDPKRTEAITVFAMSLDQRSSIASCRVTRTLGGKYKTFGALDMGYSFEPDSKLSIMTPTLLEHFWYGFASAKRTEMESS